MTQEEKQLLLIDLCGRLPYGIKVNAFGKTEDLLGIINDIASVGYDINDYDDIAAEDIKPYLRPMSSMTEEEKRELQSFFPGSFGSQWFDVEEGIIEIFECPSTMVLYLNDSKRVIDFFNSHHFDYRGLITMGLALEAKDGMYKKI